MKPFFLLLALAAILFCAAVVVSADDAERSERPRWGDDDQGRGGGDWDEDDDDDDDWGVRKAKTTTKKKCPCSTTTKKKCPCSTTTKKQCPCSTTTKKSCPCSSTTTTTTSTTTACPPKKECDWAALKTCRADSSTKFDECVERKKCTFTACVADANEQFDKCLWGGSRTERWGDDDDDEYQERKAKCLKELAEDKEKCLFQRKASHAGCVAAKECRDAKCLLHIKDCEAPKPTTTTTSTTSPSVGSSCPATDFFGPAADFNVFIAGSDTLIYDLDLVNGDIEGRAAVNGGYRVKSFGTAQAYSCPDTADQAKKYNLIVNGKMDYSNGQLFCGSSLSLSSMNDPSLRQQGYGATNARVPSGKSIKDVSGLDFDSTTGYLQGVSNYFAQYAPGTHTHFRVSQVSPADLSKISIDAGNYVQIINIKGTGDINFTNFAISSQLDPSQVIFNVVGNNKVTISGFELNGHLLALQSDVVLENGHVTGNVYSKSLVGSGSGQVNLAPCP